VKQYRQHIVTFGFFGFLISSWLFFYYLSTEKKITGYKKQFQDFEAHSTKLFSRKPSQHNLKKTVRNLKKNLQARSDDMSKKRKRPSEKITSVAQKIHKLGLTLNSCTTQPSVRKEWFTKQNVTYHLSGKMEPIRKLIKTISKKEKNLKCKKLFLATMADKRVEVELVLQFLSFSRKPFNFEKS